MIFGTNKLQKSNKWYAANFMLMNG